MLTNAPLIGGPVSEKIATTAQRMPTRSPISWAGPVVATQAGMMAMYAPTNSPYSDAQPINCATVCNGIQKAKHTMPIPVAAVMRTLKLPQ